MAGFRQLLSSLTIIYLLSATVWAADFSAFLDLEQEYTDNLFQAASDTTQEFTSNVGVGTTAAVKTRKSQLDVDYLLRMKRYWDYEGNDAFDTGELNYVDHRFNFDASTFFTGRLKAGLSENFLRGRRVRDYYLLTNRISRALFWDNRISPYLEYGLGEKLSLKIMYQYDVLTYSEEEEQFLVSSDQDSTEHRGGLTTQYSFNTRNSADLDYQYWSRDYETFPSYQAHRVTLGYQRRFRIVEAEVRGGYQNRNVEQETPGIGSEDWQGFIYELSCDAKTKKSTAGLSFEETQNDLGDIAGSYYKTRMLRWDVGHTFLGKISLVLDGYYQQIRYDEFRVWTATGLGEKRRDNVWGIGTEIKYPISRWLSLGFEFRHEDRDTNDDQHFLFGDYVENRILFTIRPTYKIKR